MYRCARTLRTSRNLKIKGKSMRREAKISLKLVESWRANLCLMFLESLPLCHKETHMRASFRSTSTTLRRKSASVLPSWSKVWCFYCRQVTCLGSTSQATGHTWLVSLATRRQPQRSRPDSIVEVAWEAGLPRWSSPTDLVGAWEGRPVVELDTRWAWFVHHKTLTELTDWRAQ